MQAFWSFNDNWRPPILHLLKRANSELKNVLKFHHIIERLLSFQRLCVKILNKSTCSIVLHFRMFFDFSCYSVVSIFCLKFNTFWSSILLLLHFVFVFWCKNRKKIWISYRKWGITSRRLILQRYDLSNER